MVEIERKFLVTSDSYKKEAVTKKRIVQGFLNTHKERTVRVRISGDSGFITVKGKSNKLGTTRFEWEKTITVSEAEELMRLCEETVIDKNRYEIPHGQFTFEVDEFLGDNEGLVVAEIELNDENDKFSRPDWLGEEVTGQIKYYNAVLSKNAYKNW